MEPDIVDAPLEEAITEATRQAMTEELDVETRSIIHSFAIVPGMMLGATWDLEDVVAELRKAKEIKWLDHPFGHDLAVRTDEDRVMLFEVSRPGRKKE